MVEKIGLVNSHTPLPLTLVVAMTADGVIGNRGVLPWSLPEDLRLFRQLTLGGTLIMGRKTFESLAAPLDGRHNLVIGRPTIDHGGCDFFSSPKAAIDRAQVLNRPTFIIGGAEIYRKTLYMCNRLVVSWVKEAVHGDTFFPDIEWSEWLADEEKEHAGFRRCFYHRVKESSVDPIRL